MTWEMDYITSPGLVSQHRAKHQAKRQAEDMYDQSYGAQCHCC